VLVIMTAIIFIIISNPHILGNLPVRGWNGLFEWHWWYGAGPGFWL
jgi:hypothetical protein